MSGKGEGKIYLGKADIFLHLKGKSKALITHIDFESDKINEIIKPKEKTFSGGKEGGIFLALNKEMIKRAEKLAKEKEK
jgi:hypothetical protein